MMYSQNGYSAKNFSVIASYTIPSTQIKIALRKGDCSVVLLELLRQFNINVQKLRQSDTGGYNPRSIIGVTTLSNHASGTAVDVRWSNHPLGAVGTFSSDQVRAIRRILAFMDGVVRWGGDYRGRKDEMHFEIIGSASAVKRVADKIRGVKAPTSHKPVSPKYRGLLKQGMMNSAAVKLAQAQLKARGWNITADGDFGQKTDNVVRQFQAQKRLAIDGKIGPKTWVALWSAPITKE